MLEFQKNCFTTSYQLGAIRRLKAMEYTIIYMIVSSLIHEISIFVDQWRLPDASFTSRAVSYLKQFYLWSSPCGEATRDLLIIFKTESLAPGNELLQRFAHESTVPKVIERILTHMCKRFFYKLFSYNSTMFSLVN